jgi:hypothetical protein
MGEHDKPEQPARSHDEFSSERMSLFSDASAEDLLKQLQKQGQAEYSVDLPKTQITGVERDGEKVKAVHYPDGTSRKFDYGNNGDLIGITQPGGTVWKRSGNTWLSNDNQRFGGKINVSRNGTYTYENSPGLFVGIDPDGRKFTQESVVGASDLESMYYQHLPQLDKDGDGQLSESEVDAGRSESGRAGYLAVALHENFRAVKKFSNDDFGTEKNITSADVYKFSLALKEQKGKKEGPVFDVDWSLKSAQAHALGIHLKDDMRPMMQNSRLGESVAYTPETLAARESAQRLANKSTAWKAGVMGLIDLPLGGILAAEAGLKSGLTGMVGVLAVEGTLLYLENKENANNIRRYRIPMSQTLDEQAYRKYNTQFGISSWQRSYR